MQPVSGVDHETHNNFLRPARRSREETSPLLDSSSLVNNIHWVLIKSFVSFLGLVLIVGTLIGIYLLIIISKSENILPPITKQENTVKYFKRSIQTTENTIMEPKSIVVMVQADIDEYDDSTDSADLLDIIKTKESTLPYNFLVSSTGQIFEALGWENNSPLLSENKENSVLLGFIGDFTKDAPTDLQLLEVTTFLEDAVRDEHLTPDYNIIGKKMKDYPKYLFLELSKLPQWSEKQSDVE